MTTILGAALVATGVAFIVLGSIWYLVSRHRGRHSDLSAWTPAFADEHHVMRVPGRRHGSGGIEIYDPAGGPEIAGEGLALTTRQHAESRLAPLGGSSSG